MTTPNVTRRSFLSRSAAGLAGAALVSGFPNIGHAQTAKAIRIGLVGCGGRGSGAVTDALRADPAVELVAMGDIAENRLQDSLANLTKGYGDRIKVGSNKFIGLDAVDKVLACDIDIVILTTPPGFRPEHLHKAVNAGKNIFCEKPLGVDAPSVRKALEATRKAKDKGLAVQGGFCWRANFAERAIWKKMHEGAIGDIKTFFGTYLTTTPWVHPRAECEKIAGRKLSELEYQLRNWMYFVWLSGDMIVEQSVHSVDKMSWTFKDVPPAKCVAIGGRQQRVEEEYGHIYDHFSVMYEWADGKRGFIFARQQSGCSNENNDYITGSDGNATVMGFRPLHVIQNGKGETWQYEKNGGPDGGPGEKNLMYVQEHKELIASIREGKPINMGEQLAHSTMLAIMGRMSAYTGRTIEWEEALNSNETWAPAGELSLDMKLETPPVPMPGRYKLPA